MPIVTDEKFPCTRYGMWTALYNGRLTPAYHQYIVCRCDCGVEKEVELLSLVRGVSTNCGCQKHPDQSGKVYGRWTLVKRVEDRHRRVHYLCRCECGTEKVIQLLSLVRGASSSCGCYNSEVASARATHGMSRTRIYSTWKGMLERCYNEKSQSYYLYGGRGIKVCNRWRNDVTAFLADMGEPPEDTSLDRIDNNGDYTPENCRWATIDVQCNNTRRNVYLTHDGETKTIAEWARHKGMGKNSLLSRLRLGWSVEDALTVPVAKRKPRRRDNESNATALSER